MGEYFKPWRRRIGVVTLLMAGHETVANSLAWALLLLARHPEAQARVSAEGQALLEQRGALSLAKVKEQLGYTRQVVDETLRLYPPLWILQRRATTDCELGGVKVERDRVVLVSPYVTQRRRDVFEQPERFDPERFAPTQGGEPQRQGYLPFGAGPRACIGRGLALLSSLCCWRRSAPGSRWRPRRPAPSTTSPRRPSSP